MSISKKPIKIIIEHSKETVNFADFVNEVIDLEEEAGDLDSKQTSPLKIEVNAMGDIKNK